ncbi:MAG: hypothetical protein L6R00_00335 [Phycisphaerae bacterium]|nr:hypothetical protein [Phycisphaerae bacterium]
MNSQCRLRNDSVARLLVGGIVGFVTVYSTGWAHAQPAPELIVSHPPNQHGGFAGDTLFLLQGQPVWQLSVDDIVLTQPALITRVTWWGFYNLDNPPASESMRIRFYSARPGDGLPGEILSDQSFPNPSRVATGLLVGVGVLPREFRYETDLLTPYLMQAGVPYWLEISQLGDVQTHFRWEISSVGNDVTAFLNPFIPDWQYSTIPTDSAFELWGIPEPGSLCLLVFGSTVLCGARRAR